MMNDMHYSLGKWLSGNFQNPHEILLLKSMVDKGASIVSLKVQLFYLSLTIFDL